MYIHTVPWSLSILAKNQPRVSETMLMLYRILYLKVPFFSIRVCSTWLAFCLPRGICVHRSTKVKCTNTILLSFGDFCFVFCC